MPTKLTRLTPLNVQAVSDLSSAIFDQVGGFSVTNTTVVFDAPPRKVYRGLAELVGSLPGRGHPKASMHAVVRKAKAAYSAEKDGTHCECGASWDPERMGYRCHR